ncbi:MAG: RHS repeat-associated core domain-containing protein [Bryobacteraceae bacterium]
MLHEMNNNMGAVTKVGYSPSTKFYLDDEKNPKTRWKTPLPFPVQVVAHVEVIDELSGGKLTTEYKYHHGYWDGAEREFRGFGMVEQFDTESFDTYDKPGLHGADTFFAKVHRNYFSYPTLSRTWFHQGPVGPEFGDWKEQDWSDQYWKGDPQLLEHTVKVNAFLRTYSDRGTGHTPSPRNRRIKRDALRTLRASILRTELYALDGSDREDRPFTVTEHAYSLREEEPPTDPESDRPRVFFPHSIAQRTTQWERGDPETPFSDPMTQFSFTDNYDDYGQPLSQTAIAMPRRSRMRLPLSATAVADETVTLVTHGRTAYAEPEDGSYIHDRTAYATSFTLAERREVPETTPNDVRAVLRDQALAASQVQMDVENALKNWKPEQGEPAGHRILGHTVNRYDGVAFNGKPLKKLGKYGALTRSETLVFTDGILDVAYGNLRPSYLGGRAAVPAGAPANFGADHGYAKKTGSSGYFPGYYIAIQQQKFDFQTGGNAKPRGLMVAMRDPLDHDATVKHDAYDLLPISVKDLVGLEIKADSNYRVLQPFRVTEPNGNFTEVEFSPMGLVTATWVKGRNGEGDQVRPSARLEYDFLAFKDRGDPIFVRTIRHVHHDTETGLPQSELNMTIESIEYSDGFGRLLQTRTQGEEVRFGDASFGGGEAVLPARQSAGRGADIVGRKNISTTAPNVVVSGLQVYDNKGRVVEKHEPRFAEGWAYAYPGNPHLGKSQKVTMFYDPRGQVIRTVNPDGSEQRVIYGVPENLTDPLIFTPTPWEAYTYDPNDLAPVSLDPDEQLPDGSPRPLPQRAPRHHHFTPVSVLIDALGRTLMAIERNRAKPATLTSPLPAIEEIRTRSTYDIQGNVLTVTDALGREAFTYIYDLAKRPLTIHSVDAGDRWMVPDAAGNVIEGRDSKGALVLRAYDVGNRPIHLWALDGAGQVLALREQIFYGDDPASSLTQAQALAENLLGKPYQQYDEAGLVTFKNYDFKGNLLEKSRRVISDTAILAVFSPPPANWDIKPLRVNWQPPGGTSLETHAAGLLDPPPKTYTTSIAYDALSRVKTLQYPADVTGTRQELLPRYNRAGALESVKLNAETYVERIAYNAQGQRTLIAYGNSVMTRHAYDPLTFRLLRMRTERYTQTDPLTYGPDGGVLQDYAYNYDLAGNILEVHDRSPESGILNTALGPDALDRAFTYDPLYRLLSATGRECDVPPPIPPKKPWSDQPRSTDQTLARPYTETFEYDAAGNMARLGHTHFLTSGNTITNNRKFDLVQNAGGVPANNRLDTVTFGADVYRYRYDDNGNLIQENTERHFEWDYADRMKVFRNQTVGAMPTTHAQYLYDAAGQRVKKYVVNQQGKVEVSIYIDGLFEHHLRGTQQISAIQITAQNNTLHVMDNQSRVALVRVGVAFQGDGAPNVPVKYHLGDHLGSSSVVIGGPTATSGTFINREEYTPYGETSFGSFGRKRYRFNGKERDEESGLNYHAARYYMPYLARWISADPLGPSAGLNLYRYAGSSPLTYSDPSGLEEKKSGSDQAPPTVCYEPQVSYDQDGTPIIHIHPRDSNVVHMAIKPFDESKQTTDDRHRGNPLEAQAKQTFSALPPKSRMIADQLTQAVKGDAAKEELRLSTPWQDQVIFDVSEHTGGNDIARAWTGASESNDPYSSWERVGFGAKGVATAASWAMPAVEYAKGLQTVRIGMFSRVPAQLSGPPVGVAFRTLEEASGTGNHYLQVSVRSKSGKVIGEWFEASETGSELLGHTEAKALSRMNLKPGQEVLFIGEFQPCNLTGGCNALMSRVARETGADIVYFAPASRSPVRFYLGGAGQIFAPK